MLEGVAAGRGPLESLYLLSLSATGHCCRPESPRRLISGETPTSETEPMSATAFQTTTDAPSTTPTLIRRFFRYYQPHRKLFALDFSFAVLSGVFELGFPMAVGLFVDRLLPGQDWGLILIAAAALAVIYLVNTGLIVVVNYWGHMLGINIETEMRRKSFDHLQKLSFRFYDNQKTGHLVARVTKDLEEIGEVAHHGPEDLFIAVMTFIGAFVLMFWVNPQLALITALIVPIMCRPGTCVTPVRRHPLHLMRHAHARKEGVSMPHQV